MAHKHWRVPGIATAANLALPAYPAGYEAAPFCDLGTRRECDDRYSDWYEEKFGKRVRRDPGSVASLSRRGRKSKVLSDV